MAELTVAAGIARGLFDFAVARGADRTALAQRSGVDPAALRDPDARVPTAAYVALMKAGQALSGDPALALHFAEAIDLSEMSVVGLLSHACETMAEAFFELSRYSRLVSEHEGAADQRFRLEPAGEGLLWMVDTRQDTNLFPEATEGAFARFVAGPRRFDQTKFCRAVHVTWPRPSYAAEYDRIFQAPVVFGSDRNALLIDASWGAHRVAERRGYAFGVLSKHAQALMDSLEQSKSVRGQVESLLIPVLHKGEVSMDTIAAKLGLSRQTLLRRLKAEGATFEIVLDELRHKLALHYLAGRKVSVNETAYLVGFSEPAAFSRAFKRWTGRNPSQAAELSLASPS